MACAPCSCTTLARARSRSPCAITSGRSMIPRRIPGWRTWSSTSCSSRCSARVAVRPARGHRLLVQRSRPRSMRPRTSRARTWPISTSCSRSRRSASGSGAPRSPSPRSSASARSCSTRSASTTTPPRCDRRSTWGSTPMAIRTGARPEAARPAWARSRATRRARSRMLTTRPGTPCSSSRVMSPPRASRPRSTSSSRARRGARWCRACPRPGSAGSRGGSRSPRRSRIRCWSWPGRCHRSPSCARRSGRSPRWSTRRSTTTSPAR